LYEAERQAILAVPEDLRYNKTLPAGETRNSAAVRKSKDPNTRHLAALWHMDHSKVLAWIRILGIPTRVTSHWTGDKIIHAYRAKDPVNQPFPLTPPSIEDIRQGGNNGIR
jgi:hypothetical protein